MCEAAGVDLKKPTFWGLDPRFWVYRKVFCRSLNPEHPRLSDESAVQIETRDGLYGFFLYNSPMLRVEVVGYIVAKAIKASGDDHKILYRLDDGTGLVHVTKWVRKGTDSIQGAANLGDLVTVRGKIKLYKGKLEIFALDLIIEEDLNAEAVHWLEVIECMMMSYKRPLELSQTEIQALRSSLGFEIMCECTGVVKNNFIYCKCTAAKLKHRVGGSSSDDQIDDWELREQVLKHLLRMERAIADDSELEFTFQDVLPSLRKLTLRWLRGVEPQVQQSEMEAVVLDVLRNVFHAFRQDGIVVLLHVYDDQYMLISKEKVIKRAIQKAKKQWLAGVPAFTSVPSVNVLLETLRSGDARLSNVPDWKIAQCIQEMQTNGDEW